MSFKIPCQMKSFWSSLILILLFFLSVYDVKNRRIPDLLVLLFACLGLPAFWYLQGVHMAGIFCLSLPLFVLAVCVPGSFGGGDVKLMEAGGWLLGARLVLYAFVFGMLAAGIYCVILLLSGRAKRNTKKSTAPFLCAGMALIIFFN